MARGRSSRSVTARPSRTRRTRSSRLSETGPLLVVAGTRPEALKLWSVATALRAGPLPTRVCLSGQHARLARNAADDVGLSVDAELPEVPSEATLGVAFSHLSRELSLEMGRTKPRGIVVQGDTSTALAGALAGFHAGLPVFHVEAGLRTTDPFLPFPEEMHRRLVTRLASLHFAPTEAARERLLADGVAPAAIAVTGNPIVDALRAVQRRGEARAHALTAGLDAAAPLFVVTLHRRENEGHAAEVARAVRSAAEEAGASVLWLRHPNATSRAALSELGPETSRVRIAEPQPYGAFVALLSRARLVLSDSGGVQEEAPVLGVPVVVLRAETDRPEAVLAGNAIVAGTDRARITAACGALLTAPRPVEQSPFGDGRAGSRIASRIEQWYAGSP